MSIYINDKLVAGSGGGIEGIAGDGLSKEGDTLSIDTPVRGVYTQEEFNALPEEQRNKGLYVIPGTGGGSGGGAGVPSGFIGMWSGATVPDGWALCDGQNGTPDLRGRFVLGQSEEHELGSTGGSEEVTLTVEQMPEHSHSYTRTSWAGSALTNATGGNVEVKISQSNANGQSDNTGSSQPHPNMPPYYTLAYIMKL